MPLSYAARAKKMPEEPDMSVLSRSKKAAARGEPVTGRLTPLLALATSDLENHRVALAAA
jgi:hypothetical protein